jgi:hypothetical protein
MEVDPLRSELDQVTAELAEAKMKYASLGAKIAGLEARRAALSKAIPGTEDRSSFGSVDIDAKYRTDDIVEILAAAGAEMSINDVVAALHDSGRPHETYDNVGADLAYLAKEKRIAKVRRGLYAAVQEPQADSDRIVITLTQGNINNHHVYLSRHLDFFPRDAIGAKNRQGGQGRLLKLHFEKLAGTAETDIAPDHKIFRLRDRRWDEFFRRHDLHAGDKVTIERISEYEYRVARLRSTQTGAGADH